MEKKEMNAKASIVPLPMNGGESAYSYATNSSFQREGIDPAKTLISEEIAHKFHLSPSCSLFTIADLGCSIGPNTFIIVRSIIDALELKSQSQGPGPKKLEYQVFFNDQTSNDFNTLFRSLPQHRNYFAAGVPGSFHDRLFPDASLHFVNSFYALHWLSKVPEEVVDRSSPAWNKGSIHQGSRKEVTEAYAAQFGKDVECFLKARAEELKNGGFMAILIPSIQDGTSFAKCTAGAIVDLMGSTLLDMAKMGLVDEDDIDSFNLPVYHASPSHFKTLVEKNGFFKIHRMETLGHQMAHVSRPNVEKFSFALRATFEALISEHFGSEIIDNFFGRYTEKLVESGLFSDPSLEPLIDLFVLVERINP